MKDGLIVLEKGKEVIVSMNEVEGTPEKFSVTYENLINDVNIGSYILLDDGLVELQVKEINKDKGEVKCDILNTGELKNKKGVNLPGVKVNLPGITDKDADDIRFGIKENVDFIAASFVRRPSDVLDIRQILEEEKAEITIFPKIENQEGIDNIEEILEDLDKKLQRGIESLHDSLDNVIKEMFKNLDHDFEDGVTEEMMKHLNVVNNNINFVKKQNDVYGEQITDIKNIMSHQDATVMDGNLSINYSGEHMISGQVQSSNYLTRKMTILKNHIDNAVNKISDYVQETYNNYFEPVLNYILEVIHSVETAVRHIYEISSLIYKSGMKIKIKAMGINVDEIDKMLEVLKSKLKNLDEFLNNLKIASPILENHLDDIVRNMKPLIVNQIFEPSHYDDMFILNTQAHARLDQMAQQFEVVCNGLNENEGQAIQTMDQSASLIRSNLIQVKEQLEKLAVY